jgi:colanic acid/amylovoran biosynthesis glycosyltransferase
VHIEQAGLRGHVRLLGARSGSEVKALLDDADLFVLACVVAPDGDRDGMPVALAEAMAMGLPVVSTELPGIDELVRPGTGILVPQHDVRALAEAIDEIGKASPGARAAMGRAGRAVVLESFVVAAGVDRLVTLFRAAIARSSAPSGNELEGDASGLAASGAGRR